jgi:hypothetical protein
MLRGCINMAESHALDELRKKAHEINCVLVEADYTPREIEIIGYYLKRIAASYLSYQTHKELAKAEEETKEISPEKQYEIYGEYL